MGQRNVRSSIIPAQPEPRRALVTGGAGFIGCNLVADLLRDGAEVTLLDNFSRSGSRRNLEWLRAFPEARARLRVIAGDVRHPALLAEACQNQHEIYHLAAQVAVTHSLLDPRLDFEINLAGTFNLLEAVRHEAPQAFVLFTSTNKVYGALDGAPGAAVGETQPLDLHSPYGCSKGAADQYVRDYARVYGLRSVVLRMSCIYGPRQNGTEDQGWVAHFIFAALRGDPVWIYGDGRQVRDLLFVDDLLAAMRALRRIPAAAGQVFNVGGGSGQARSVRQVLHEIEALTGRAIETRPGPWRVGDQRAYISDTAKLRKLTGWQPRVEVADGLAALYQWACDCVAAETGSPVRHGFPQSAAALPRSNVPGQSPANPLPAINALALAPAAEPAAAGSPAKMPIPKEVNAA